MINLSMGNIIRSVPVSVAAADFTDENGFFIRSGAGNICYCPVGNLDSEAITKTGDAQVYFVDPNNAGHAVIATAFLSVI